MPKVFISFTHESEEHDRRVDALAAYLRQRGIEAETYLTELFPQEGWTLWMTRKIEEADFVLIVCTGIYRKRWDGKEASGTGGGTKWESRTIRSLLHQAGTNAKFVPVLLDPADKGNIPLDLYDYRYFTLIEFDLDNREFRELYRLLTSQPERAAELGALVVLDPLNAGQNWKPLLARPWNVPPLSPFFTGRSEQIEALRERLSQTKIAALTGLGGIGKTQTAIQYAHRYRGDYSGVFWVNASSEDGIAAGMDAAAPALKEDSGWLLIFDNADDPALLKRHIPEGTGEILLTSRKSILDAAGVLDPFLLPVLTPEESLRFLFGRVGRAPEDPHESAAACAVAEEVGYLPLALEQVGAFVFQSKSRFADYLNSYRKRQLDLLEKRGPVGGDYPESVRTTWTLNFGAVRTQQAAAGDLLCLIAWLGPDDIPVSALIQAADHLGPELCPFLKQAAEDPILMDELLSTAENFSLIRRHPSEQSFSIHRLVQRVLADSMPEERKKLWAMRAVDTISLSLGETDPQPARLPVLMSHALTCLEWILRWSIESGNSKKILEFTGMWLFRRARFGAEDDDRGGRDEIEDYLRFFHLRQSDIRRTGEGRAISFKPSGMEFRALVTVEIVIDDRLDVGSVKLALARKFIDSHNRLFAQDMAKSFLKAVSSPRERGVLEELINEIWRPPGTTSNRGTIAFFTGIGDTEIPLERRELVMENVGAGDDRVLSMSFRS